MAFPMVHFELGVTDVKKAMGFYEKLFGWKYDWDEKMKYGMVQPDDGPGGGLMKAEGPIPPYSLIYIGVPDINEFLDKAVSLGGKVQVARTEIPGDCAFGIFSDPDGIMIGLFEGGHD